MAPFELHTNISRGTNHPTANIHAIRRSIIRRRYATESSISCSIRFSSTTLAIEVCPATQIVFIRAQTGHFSQHCSDSDQWRSTGFGQTHYKMHTRKSEIRALQNASTIRCPLPCAQDSSQDSTGAAEGHRVPMTIFANSAVYLPDRVASLPVHGPCT